MNDIPTVKKLGYESQLHVKLKSKNSGEDFLLPRLPWPLMKFNGKFCHTDKHYQEQLLEDLKETHLQNAKSMIKIYGKERRSK